MIDVIDICEAHGQPPSWWDRLSSTDRAMMQARHRLRRERGTARGR